MMRSLLLKPFTKPVVFALALLPFGWLLYGALTQNLGPNPAEALIRSTGDWTLRALCVVLAVTPLRVITATPALARFRRMLGLFVYFYAVLHLLCYSWLDMAFVLGDIVRDIAKRPFILVGFAAVLLLTALAATSSTGSALPHNSTGAPTCASGSPDRSTASISIDTRPMSRVRTPATSTGVPSGACRG